MANITLVDDDENIVASVSLALESHGHKITAYHDGASGLEALLATPPDLVILDVKMPRMDGMEVLRKLRQTSQIPVIMLTSKDEESDEILGFNLGADDYLTKPFDVEELLARMAATLRRSRVTDLESSVAEITFGQIRIDMEAKAVFKNHDRVQLTPTEFSLLRVLALNMGRLMSYRELLREVWGVGYETSREYVRVYVGRLRSKLEEADGPALIVTEPRAGYRLVAPEQQ